MKIYRGACTVKDWSNTTACPTHFCCDKGECPQPTMRLSSKCTTTSIIITAAYSFFPVLVYPSSWSNIWQCPPVNNGPIRWWCGDEAVTPPCQSGVNASFLIPTAASELGLPPVTFSQPVGTKNPSDLVTTLFSSGTTDPKATYTNPSVPAQTPEHSANLTTAIGVGVGVLLGIAAIGFLGFLSWKLAERKCKGKSRIQSQEHAQGNGDQSASVVIDRPRTELPDAQLRRELDDTGMRELPRI